MGVLWTNPNAGMQGIQIGDLYLRVLAGVLRKVARVERHIVQEIGIADQRLLVNS